MQKNMMWILAALSFTVGCGDKDASTDSGADDSAVDDTNTDSTLPTGIEIAGDWADGWGGSHTISDTSWVSGSSSYAIAVYDNDADFAVAQNAATNTYNPNLWSRFDWTWDGEALYYCQFAYDAASQADAEAATGADRSDLAAGCNGFGWTTMTAP